MKFFFFFWTDCRKCDVLQAIKQAAEQRSQELSDQVDRLTQQAVEAAAESQSCLNAAMQRAAKEAEEANVMLFISLCFILRRHLDTAPACQQSSFFISCLQRTHFGKSSTARNCAHCEKESNFLQALPW